MAKVLKTLLAEKFPEATEDEVCKVGAGGRGERQGCVWGCRVSFWVQSGWAQPYTRLPITVVMWPCASQGDWGSISSICGCRGAGAGRHVCLQCAVPYE